MFGIVSRVATAFALLVASPALADCGTLLMPPPQYERALPYVPVVRIMAWDDVAGFCAQHGVHLDRSEREMEACSYGQTIVLSQVGTGGVTLERQQCEQIHETAHLWPNMWPADHPGAVFE